MNHLFLRFSALSFLFLIFFISPTQSTKGQAADKVTAGSAGAIKIGMKLSEARAAMPDFKFERTSDGEGIALVAVIRGEDTLLTLYAGEEDSESAVDFNAVIQQIEVWNSSYRTAEGIGPGTLIVDSEKKYGPVKEIMLSEIEARQYAEFSSGPKGIDFRIDYSGVYEVGKNTTKRYKSGAKIMSLIISGDGSETNVGFYSSYTDLENECKTPEGQGEEGGHVSTYCEGPDEYVIHMFDTAASLEITAQSKRMRYNLSIIRESLDFSTKGKKVEWRFKNGVPFAVIMRGNTYETEDGLFKYPAKVTGEYLYVRGLAGFESISSEVNVRTEKFANEEARKIADEGYVSVKFPVSKAFEDIETSDKNLMIVTAANKNESWVKSPMQVATKITGEFSEMKSKTMRFDSAGEGSDSFTLIVINDGLMDDSVKSEKWIHELIRETSGVWKVSSIKKSWSCWPGRGHEDFSGMPCV